MKGAIGGAFLEKVSPVIYERTSCACFSFSFLGQFLCFMFCENIKLGSLCGIVFSYQSCEVLVRTY